MKTKPNKEKKPMVIKEGTVDLEGLKQTFQGPQKKLIRLDGILDKADWWVLKKRNYSLVIVTHAGVKKIALAAGIKTDPEYSVLTQPTYENNYQYTIQVRICDSLGRCSTELGEVNRSNLGTRGRNNPANMAQKRAFDRAVFTHLGITGLLGEDELEESNEEKRLMDNLSLEEQKEIVPEINAIFAITTDQGLVIARKEIKAFSDQMRANIGKYSPEKLTVLRELFEKKRQSVELEATF